MLVRKAEERDIAKVSEIFASARAYMRKNGNNIQWTGEYPGESDVIKDIDLGRGYVVEKDGEVAGYFCYFIGHDPTYDVVYGGEWLNDLPYGVVHRLATLSQAKGVGTFAVNWCFEQCGNLKLDTHRINTPMINMVTKAGFTKCGVIHVNDGLDPERIAFQKVK
ncbi:MAG: GNAT family N-acetyltransferase [Eubacteriaceae bacterium]|nr:GNAT family N-acetyltransferase [Eubacteriaceae bacterium]